jgi:hypothetical protein
MIRRRNVFLVAAILVAAVAGYEVLRWRRFVEERHLQHVREYEALTAQFHVGMSGQEVRRLHPDNSFSSCPTDNPKSGKPYNYSAPGTTYYFIEKMNEVGVRLSRVAVCVDQTDRVRFWYEDGAPDFDL